MRLFLWAMIVLSSWKNICWKPIYIYNSCDHYNEKFRVVTKTQGYRIHKGGILEEEAIELEEALLLHTTYSPEYQQKNGDLGTERKG